MKIWIYTVAGALLTMGPPVLANTTNSLEPNKTKNHLTVGVDDPIEGSQTLYVATNKTEGNSIVAIRQHKDGSLSKLGEYMTGGKGTGNIEIFDWGYDETHPLKDGIDPLISAYGIMSAQDGKTLLVVNSGDATVSSLKVNGDGSLTLNNVVAAGDIHPVSIAVSGNNVAVASSGANGGNIMAYQLNADGHLSVVEGSKRDLGARPSCIAFSTNGKHVIVNELATGMIKIYGTTSNGSLSAEPVSKLGSPHNKDAGRWLPIPVGFDIVGNNDNTIILMSEARFLDNMGNLREEANKVPQSPKYSWQTGSTSSYLLDANGKLSLVSGDVMTGSAMEGGQIANCWVEASKDGKELWAANALSSSISSYAIGNDGSIELMNETTFKKADESLFFSDLYMSHDGKYLNQLIGNKGGIMVFEIMKGEAGKESKLISKGMYSEFGIPEVGSYGMISI